MQLALLGTIAFDGIQGACFHLARLAQSGRVRTHDGGGLGVGADYRREKASSMVRENKDHDASE